MARMLRTLAGMILVAVVGSATAEAQRQELREPAELRPEGGVLRTELRCALSPFQLGETTLSTRLYNGQLPSATWRIKAGDTIKVRLINDMPPNPDEDSASLGNYPQRINTTNLHTHGLNVSPRDSSDNVLLAIKPGERFDYSVAVGRDHASGSYWYHPHHHTSTSPQVMSGMAGMIIVEDDPAVAEPGLLALDDVVMVFQSLLYDSLTNTMPYPTRLTNPFTPIAGKETPILVNGMHEAKLTMRPGETKRLRLCNATNESQVMLFVQKRSPDGVIAIPQFEIAVDGLYLPGARTMPAVTVVPGSRSDVLLQAPTDIVEGETYWLVMRELDRSFRTVETRDLIQIVVAGEAMTPYVPFTLPAPMTGGDIRSEEITGTRTLTFSIGDMSGIGEDPTIITRSFLIDSTPYDHDVVNMTLRVGDVEEWTIRNVSDDFHPFHIHVNEFQLVEDNGLPLEVPEWHDVLLLRPQSTYKVRMRIDDNYGKTVLHCHFLAHEDWGMMQVIDIQPLVGVDETQPWQSPELFPNPVAGRFSTVKVRLPQFLAGTKTTIRVVDITGEMVLVKQVDAADGELATLELDELGAGTYYVMVTNGPRYRETTKLVLVR